MKGVGVEWVCSDSSLLLSKLDGGFGNPLILLKSCPLMQGQEFIRNEVVVVDTGNPMRDGTASSKGWYYGPCREIEA